MRVMLEWAEVCWRYVVSEPCVLIFDSFAVHKCDEEVAALANYGTAVRFVPGGCTSVAQPLDVGVVPPPSSQAFARPTPSTTRVTPSQTPHGKQRVSQGQPVRPFCSSFCCRCPLDQTAHR
ncbi:hypothetical protein PybrP1_010750 [[Pythium] brassicae (nom. inval.)]|nr:hypothetical protein PybrP1_010750 [[Pythium] brassicae (nom. inval.)]